MVDGIMNPSDPQPKMDPKPVQPSIADKQNCIHLLNQYYNCSRTEQLCDDIFTEYSECIRKL
jgi:hypothetical protein